MNNLKKIKNNKKGFTLVEIIVVLVIIAVLAAAAIPTMIGFVEDSKGKAEIANARAAYIACQAIATEEYASGTDTKSLVTEKTYTIAVSPGASSETNSPKLNQMLGADMAKATVTPTVNKLGKVEKVVYVDVNNKYTVTIEQNKAAQVEKVVTPAAAS